MIHAPKHYYFFARFLSHWTKCSRLIRLQGKGIGFKSTVPEENFQDLIKSQDPCLTATKEIHLLGGLPFITGQCVP